LKDFQRKKGKYIVPGPDFVWCIDGYMKLELFGIEIYAAIDGYSRYIIWTYVGSRLGSGTPLSNTPFDTPSATTPLGLIVDPGPAGQR
jgi:hypothetical protein